MGGLPSPSQPSPVKNPSAAPIYESRAQVLYDLSFYSTDPMIFQKQLRLAREKSNPPKPAVTPNPKTRTSTRDKSQKLYHIDKFEKLGNGFMIYITLWESLWSLKTKKKVKRSYHAFRRSNESASLPSGSPKPVNKVCYHMN